MLFTNFLTLAVIFAVSSPVFSLTSESTKIISGIETVIQQAHTVDDTLKNFDGGISNAISTAKALFYGQKASNELQGDLKDADPLPAEDMPQFLSALDGLHVAIINATKTTTSLAPLMRSKGFRIFAANALNFYTSENKAYAEAIRLKIPESHQQEVDGIVQANAAELENALALFR